MSYVLNSIICSVCVVRWWKKRHLQSPKSEFYREHRVGMLTKTCLWTGGVIVDCERVMSHNLQAHISNEKALYVDTYKTCQWMRLTIGAWARALYANLLIDPLHDFIIHSIYVYIYKYNTASLYVGGRKEEHSVRSQHYIGMTNQDWNSAWNDWHTLTVDSCRHWKQVVFPIWCPSRTSNFSFRTTNYTTVHMIEYYSSQYIILYIDNDIHWHAFI